MYGTVAEVMRFQVLFRQWTRVRHALKGGRHDARGKRVAPDLNLLYLTKYLCTAFQFYSGHSILGLFLLAVAKGTFYHLALTEIQLER